MAKKPPNKNQSETKNQKNATSSSTSSFPIGKLFFVSAILAGLASFYAYKVLTTPPPLPKLDLDKWWGSYPIDQEKDESIRPFEIEFSDVIVNDLRERLLHRRPFAPPLEDAGFTYGFNTNFLSQVLDYWQNKYNFKDRENFFNKYKHYKTKIQGLDIHFMHVKPKVTDDVEVVPLLLLHGWPGSFREFYEMAPKLTTPRPDRDFVFELIVPSLPGFGYSQGAARPGFGPVEMAGVLHQLMQRAGLPRYGVQGGDAGHALGAALATLFPNDLIGFHTNFPTVLFNPMATVYMYLGSFWPSLIVEPELESRMYPMSAHLARMVEESGYMHLQATKPDTIGAALTDSPAGLAAYILEKFSTWTNMDNKRAADGNLLKRFQLTHLIDNLMVYWATNSITTSVRLYAETFSKKNLAHRLDEIPTDVPTWGIKLKHELVFQPECALRLKYRNYLRSSAAADGGHFAAMELPDALAADVYQAFAAFREFHEKRTRRAPSTAEPTQTIYEFTVNDLNGRSVKLDKYRGHVVLVVNVASQCGLTDTNYQQLNQLHDEYAPRGLRILAFPCNQFGGQEPGTRDDIFKFTRSRGVKFDLFEKVDVNGDHAHPLWRFLKKTRGGTIGDFIKWNFSKFIVDRRGVPVERYGPNVNPLDLEHALVKYL